MRQMLGWFLFLTVITGIACATLPTGPADVEQLPPIVCGSAPDGDFCCVSVRAGRLVEQCRREEKHQERMKKELDKSSASRAAPKIGVEHG